MAENEEWLQQIRPFHPESPERAYAFPMVDYLGSFTILPVEVERFIGNIVAHNTAVLPMHINTLVIHKGQVEFDADGTFERHKEKVASEMQPGRKAYYMVDFAHHKSIQIEADKEARQHITIAGGRAFIRGNITNPADPEIETKIAKGYESQRFDLKMFSATEVSRQFQTHQLRLSRVLDPEAFFLDYPYNLLSS
jgi:hypothetical protein